MLKSTRKNSVVVARAAAGTKKRSIASVTTTGTSLDADESLSRLQRNREISARCRKRKREKLARLLDTVAELRLENAAIKRQVKCKWTSRTPTSDSIAATTYTKNDVSYDTCKQAKFHMQELRSLLLPTGPTAVSLWLLEQNDDFFNEKINAAVPGGSAWNMLAKSLELTNFQKLEIKNLRSSCVALPRTSLRNDLISTVNQVKLLERDISESCGATKHITRKCKDALSPDQLSQMQMASLVRPTLAFNHTKIPDTAPEDIEPISYEPNKITPLVDSSTSDFRTIDLSLFDEMWFDLDQEWPDEPMADAMSGIPSIESSGSLVSMVAGSDSCSSSPLFL